MVLLVSFSILLLWKSFWKVFRSFTALSALKLRRLHRNKEWLDTYSLMFCVNKWTTAIIMHAEWPSCTLHFFKFCINKLFFYNIFVFITRWYWLKLCFTCNIIPKFILFLQRRLKFLLEIYNERNRRYAFYFVHCLQFFCLLPNWTSVFCSQ